MAQVRWQLVVDQVEELLTEMLGGISNIPDIVAGKVDPKHAVKVRKSVDETVRGILNKLSVSRFLSKLQAGD